MIFKQLFQLFYIPSFVLHQSQCVSRDLHKTRYPTAQHDALDEMLEDGIFNLCVEIWGSSMSIGIRLTLISARQLLFMCRAKFWSISWCLNRSTTF